MIIPVYLLLALGLLGATDILLYHSISHGIRSHPDSRLELITHSLRGPTYAALFVIVPNFALYGWCFALLLALLVFDVLISIADFAIERESRRFFGGLPSGEYVLHMILAMVFGAFAASLLYEHGNALLEPAAFMYQPATVPGLLRLVLAIMALLVFVSGVQDAIAAVRLAGKPLRAARIENTDGRG